MTGCLGRGEGGGGRPQCAQGFSMSLEHNRCQFANRQQLKMQETPDEMPDGETPQTVSAQRPAQERGRESKKGGVQ